MKNGRAPAGRRNNVRRWALGLAVPVAVMLAIVLWKADGLTGREPAEEAGMLRAALALAPGMTACEVGAGDGQLAIEVARAVAPDGRVYATELDRALVDRIRDRARTGGSGRVEAVQAAEDGTNLPTASCDAVYMRRVYHDLTSPAPIVADIRRALRPGGRLAIIDFEPSLLGNLLMPRRTNRHGHGIRQADLVREVSAQGFTLASPPSRWDGEMFVAVFRSAGR